MRLPRECYQMQKTIETHLPHLSQPQLTGLVLWVCGAILAGSACQNAVASALSPWRNWNNLRQYLREWLYDGSDRTSPCQTELDVSLCFAPLLRWVLTWWRSGRLALAVDPTLKGDQTTAIVISVVYRSCAIPVAWSIRRATQRGSWMDPTVELLQELAPAVPQEMTVIVLCDRGIASPKLWKQIRDQGWHPYMRYPKSITFCAQGGRRLPARAFVPRPDTAWIGQGTAFGTAAAKRRCTLLVVWYAGQEEPWIILTDLPPEDAGPSWYALRFWIELGFKALKSLGWKWDKTRRTDPARISRHWLVLSVATLLALAYGTRVEDAQDRRIAPGSLRAPPKALAPNHRDPRSRPARTVSVIRHGIDWLRRLLLKGRLWSRVWAAARTLAPTQSPTWRSPIMRPRNSPYLPLSAWGPRDLRLREGTIVDATIIEALSSTKNRAGERDPEMHQTRKGNQWHFGMKAHIGVDSETGIVHSMSATAANAHDVTETHNLLHGGETVVRRGAGCQGVGKREENQGLEVEWRVAMRPRRRRKLDPGSEEALAETEKASVRAKVEHAFLKLKRLFGYGKVRYRGTGEERRALGAAVRAEKPADGGGSTEGVVRPVAFPTGPEAPRSASKEVRQGRNSRD